ncbi:hypothetical protein SAMN05444064_10386 [Pseudomonas syringae]|uniref:hypothetical protein n=1 Tax=Pseudomonas syringae TaxID=317 RepID=UPI00089B9963|nr:hypothetical protein [Pseudomonas syringae]SDW37034.1 hypothetical protein SAMN05444514_10386 [Pseudomonas syringae]SFL65529.1 hypothetical protein SAMN05444064_10386 [Pseudomonas syringae]
MTVELKKSDLQQDLYKYVWKRVDTDGKYIGPLDRNKVSKVEGYEVLEFVENFLNDHKLKVEDTHKVENALHAKELSAVVLRKDLIAAIKKKLGL